MSDRPVLLVHGQGLGVASAGGAAKYAEVLHDQLKVRESVPPLSQAELRLEYFGSALGGSPTRDKLVRTAKQIVSPIVWDALRSLKKKAPNGGSSENERPVVLHEITNHHTHAALGRLSLRKDFRLCATFVDVQDLYYPQFFSDASLTERTLLYNFFRERADLIFAISDFTRDSICEKLKIDPTKVRVTPLAADDIRESPDPSMSEQTVARSLGRYLIYPARPWAHKNHEGLIRAIAANHQAFSAGDLRLLLVGGFSKAERARLEWTIADEKVSDCVQILGFVKAGELKALIQNAEAMVFPSLFEGFGMPVLEAMELGCPVLSSSLTSLKEVGGDAPIYFNPLKPGEMEDVLKSAAEGKIDWAHLRAAGRKNAERFSWKQTAEKTISGYAELLSSLG